MSEKKAKQKEKFISVAMKIENELKPIIVEDEFAKSLRKLAKSPPPPRPHKPKALKE